MNTLKSIKELTLKELYEKYDLEEFNSEEYTLDGLSHETVKLCGYEYTVGDCLKSIDPTAFRQVELDWLDNMLTDEAVAEAKDGYVWIQDIDLDALGLKND